MRKLAISLAVATGCFAGGPSHAADTIQAGICLSWPSYSMVNLAQKKGLIKGRDVNFVFFEDALGGHASLAAGQIDALFCTSDYTPLIVDRGTNVTNVGIVDVSYGVDHIILAKDTKIEDIKGKKVSAPQAFLGHLLMGQWLESHGIKVDEVEWVNMNADEAVGPMLSGDLAAGYMYEPWISKVLKASPGSKSVSNSGEDAYLRTGVYTDSIFMNKSFIAEDREGAKTLLKAHYDGVTAWNENVEDGNEEIAKFLQWPAEDVGYVIGTNGKSFKGGIYVTDFDEAARFCGSLEGKPPFGIENGSFAQAIAETNKRWIKLGLMKNEIDAQKGVDCSLIADLVADGYRQSISAHQ